MTISTMPVYAIPPNDEDRLKKLYQYDILDTPAEYVFDKIAILASQIFDTPNAFITFVDKDRVFFKSNISTLESSEVLRHHSFCSVAILQPHTTILNDIHTDPRFVGTPLLMMERGTRFYAGALLITVDGYILGTLNVTDIIPREVTAKQINMLETLASIIMDELDNRLRTRKNVRVHTDLMNITVHDLKSPLSAIKLYGQLINKKSTEDAVRKMSNKITYSADNILDSLNDLLNLSQIEDGFITVIRKRMDICELLQKVKDGLEVLAHQKQQVITIHKECAIFIELDGGRIQDVFENLLSNAIKYTYPGGEIDLYVTEENGYVLVEFRDQGQGLNEADMGKLFTRYAKLSAVPTGKERSNGLGLSIVKTLVELHQGKVWAESAGKGKGSSFFVSLPIP
ncbi:GAF domain-containing sensor histidine kinase [Mucilaginibacter sp. HMF5004]|uniref:GAF domain-containing sensor histidine kinase n=1 Tax=Mucilaginibacter rivuli TaxID=2857527 RepID=UPI001C5CCFBB|nr:GAF domain-containing sensor histidine kinase [Mucilaginibacter rivuli]MBW4891891.1 GAF domain-containing sensor histidine kinase [Mucilaginibacter rivuli]